MVLYLEDLKLCDNCALALKVKKKQPENVENWNKKLTCGQAGMDGLTN